LSLAIEWVTELAAFAALAGQWDALLAADSRPFDLNCWYVAWWKAFGGGELAVCTARGHDGSLVGAFPLASDGALLTGLANSHSGMFRPLAADDAALDAVLAAAAARGQGMRLEALPREDPSVERLASALRGASRVPVFEPGDVSAIVDTSGDLDSWVESSNKSWKGRLRRYRRKMERDYEAEISIMAVPADLDSELDEGFRVEASGWKGEAGTAILSAPETEAFYREIAAVFQERGELRMNRIVLDGRLVAFSICIQHRGRLYSLKSGFDEDYRKLMTGLVLQLSIVESCFEQGLAAYELLGNRSDWKEKFANDDRALLRLSTFRRTPVGLGTHAYRTRLRPLAKRAYRRVRPVA
jgi:CelD/BcsL family acetyltransferase involved in cellulose biosynthesis